MPALSISFAVGSNGLSQPFSFSMVPYIQLSGETDEAFFLSLEITSSKDDAEDKSSECIALALVRTWIWESLKPGITETLSNS